MADIELTIGSRIFGGWTSASVTRSMETMSGTFRLSVSERFPGQQGSQGIQPGNSCMLSLDGETVITGWVDEISPTYSASSHTISISGRDRTGDLVDCSAINPPGQWKKRKLEAIAHALAHPFKVSVTAEIDTGPVIPSFSIHQGETAYEAIERLCRKRGVLATSSPQGNLVITRAGARRAGVSLKRGENILSASGTFSHIDRYKSYQVKAQQPGNDESSTTSVAQILAREEDPGIDRYRPLVLLAEQASDAATAQARVTWEASVRAARARRVNVTLQGWSETQGGSLWWPNRVVQLSDSWLGIEGDMLITSVEYSYSEQGSLTKLEMMPPGAFELRPPSGGSGQNGVSS